MSMKHLEQSLEIFDRRRVAVKRCTLIRERATIMILKRLSLVDNVVDCVIVAVYVCVIHPIACVFLL